MPCGRGRTLEPDPTPWPCRRRRRRRSSAISPMRSSTTSASSPLLALRRQISGVRGRGTRRRLDGIDEIAYTFGVYPLQQYLIAFPGGRLQALGIAWDSRPKEQGGQRWFHLYPDQKLPAGDRLHWTGRDQTWNYMCADCHSTGLRKNYDLATNTYATTWTDVDVSCEACHGPGSRHVAWAQSHAGRLVQRTPAPKRTGPDELAEGDRPGHWEMNPEPASPGAPSRSPRRNSTPAPRATARRRVIAKDAVPGTPFLDSYAPALLEPGPLPRRRPDRRRGVRIRLIRAEPHDRAGVTCSNCHEPHSLELRAEGNALCSQCHLPAKFDAAEHHHHSPGSAGAQCVNCHMPTKTYMVVDRRRDHSFRVPRPDLSASIGTPNACTACHTDRSADWAAQAIAGWYPQGRQTTPHYGTALHAGRDRRRRCGTAARSADPRSEPTGDCASQRPAAAAALRHARVRSRDQGGDRRSERARSHRRCRARCRPSAVASRRSRQSRRCSAIRSARCAWKRRGHLPASIRNAMTPDQRNAFDSAYRELVAAEMVDADRPEAHLNLGLLDLRRQQPAEAEAEYRTALRLDPSFVPALVNLADLDRCAGRISKAPNCCARRWPSSRTTPTSGIRSACCWCGSATTPRRWTQLRQATELAPDNARYAYVYAIALNSTGAAAQAMALAGTHSPAASGGPRRSCCAHFHCAGQRRSCHGTRLRSRACRAASRGPATARHGAGSRKATIPMRVLPSRNCLTGCQVA